MVSSDKFITAHPGGEPLKDTLEANTIYLGQADFRRTFTAAELNKDSLENLTHSKPENTTKTAFLKPHTEI